MRVSYSNYILFLWHPSPFPVIILQPLIKRLLNNCHIPNTYVSTRYPWNAMMTKLADQLQNFSYVVHEVPVTAVTPLPCVFKCRKVRPKNLNFFQTVFAWCQYFTNCILPYLPWYPNHWQFSKYSIFKWMWRDRRDGVQNWPRPAWHTCVTAHLEDTHHGISALLKEFRRKEC